ncbi:MAG: hypothetical protein V4760_16695 [Bdellovibrionota bacterium]
MNSKVTLTLACLATLAVAVACGKGGANGNASIKEIKQEERIAKGVRESFPGYDPSEKNNIEMAARFLGATIEIVAKSQKSESSAPGMSAKVTMLLEKPDVEITGEGTFDEGFSQSLELVKTDKDKAIPTGYSMEARCMSTSECNHVLAILVLTEDLAAGSNTSEAGILDNVVAGSISIAAGTNSIAAGTNSAAKPETPKADVESATEAPVLTPKKKSAVAVLFAKQKDGRFVIAWSASSSMDYLKGGKRESVAEVKAAREKLANGTPKAQPAEGGAQDPVPPIKGAGAASAPEDAAG